MTEEKSRDGLTDANHALGEVLQAFGEALLASTDITIEHMQELRRACKRGAEACRRAIEMREAELSVVKADASDKEE